MIQHKTTHAGNPGEREKRQASIGSPVMEAVANGLFRFTAEHQLRTRLARIREEFLISKDQDAANPDSIKLWVKGYALTEDERGKGYLGNYALIRPQKSPDGKYFSLIAEKLTIDLKFHPRKKRPKLKHPDWGHPILRAVLKKKLYGSIEEVQAEFARLHSEFPDVSIPGLERLNIIVYQKGKPAEKGNPVQKITLRIRPNEDGRFYISYALNKKKPKIAPAPGAEPPVQKSTKGYFTALVSMKKKKPGAREAAVATLAEAGKSNAETEGSSNGGETT